MKTIRITILRIIYGLAVFIVSALIFMHVSTREDTTRTGKMPEASLPVVTMQAGNVTFNELHGFTAQRTLSAYRAVLTPLDSDREVRFSINPYGETLTSLGYEVRTLSGGRLIEDAQIDDYTTMSDGTIPVSFTLKDLIDAGEEYVLDIRLSTSRHEDIRYYTRIIYDTDNSTLYQDAVSFVNEFHEAAIEGTDTAYLAEYIEPDDSKSGDSYAHVTIHSSIDQVSYGSLRPEEVVHPVYSLTEEEGSTFFLTGTYLVSCTDPEDDAKQYYYDCREYYRIYKGFDRFHLMDYSRDMIQIYNPENGGFTQDAINLGITDTGLQIGESPDGEILSFVNGGRLYSINLDTSTISYIFGFADEDSTDRRQIWQDHDIRILRTSDDGGVDFLVYGYMNRGDHEGTIGISVYHYNPQYRTIEENSYISYGGSYALLQDAVSNAAYLNDEGDLYLLLEDVLYTIDIDAHQATRVDSVAIGRDPVVSEGGRMIAWKEEEGSLAGSIILMDLKDFSRSTISPENGEVLTPVGFLGEDLIYGLARRSDASTDITGIEFLPMYAVRIVDRDLNTLEDYSRNDYYITEAVIEGSQITLHRVQKTQNGYIQASDDQIVSAAQDDDASRLLSLADSDTFGSTVTLTASGFEPSRFRYIRPREVIYGTDGTSPESTAFPDAGDDAEESSSDKYYVYGTYGYERFYYDVSDAVRRASSESAVVVDGTDNYVWKPAWEDRCQIDDIGSAKDYASLIAAGETTAVNACLDAMLVSEGVQVDVDSIRSSGMDARQLIEQYLPGSSAIDLTGCSLEEILYYPCTDTPVLALTGSTGDGSAAGSQGAVLVIGYGPENIAVWDPAASDAVTIIPRTQAAALFTSAGSRYLTFLRARE